ncbi:MAG: DNA-packaging protein [Lachnospiraceae bacterium]|nr:DNA-packaging protein [Lachnospiraceae bacterium]
MSKVNNFPTGQVENLEPHFVSKTIENLRQLYDLGQPQTDDETEQRINQYFAFCQRTESRPGIEGLCMSLAVSRTTIFRWANGENCSTRKKNIICRAKSFINAFLEQSALQGKLSPPTAIFLMKNWMSYSDTTSIELLNTRNEMIQTPEQTALDIAARHRPDECMELPEKPDFSDDFG